MLETKNKAIMLKLLTFVVGNLHLAIRLDGVEKVTPMPQVYKSGSKKFLGITQVDDQKVIVLDLYQKLLGQSTQKSSGFLAVVQTQNTRYGFTAVDLPIMREVPEADFCPIPQDYRDNDALGISEKMATIILEDGQETSLFLLDPKQLLHLLSLQSRQEETVSLE